ncbi:MULTISPECIES: capsular polysaccharide biosynthesis protein [Burkholderia]|uniref:Capsule polysaccharide biosynthesis family protein n=1 Tax=Burkholderia cepacia TaxID=292 RepID=A0AA88Z582_BURCE|nr:MULTISPECIES: capsular biosynthesis protein [Burkholderia]KGB98865.1 capsule polysaccharide biosynthesis family protein [Burkholderia cepacia]KWE62066.1 capsular biosynthesis protein [Burkholderia sp. MSMB2157WGS]
MTPEIQPFDATAMVPGKRRGHLPIGKSPFVWIDSWRGVALARTFASLGRTVYPVAPGPVLGRRTMHAPPLSWFRIPPDLVTRGGLVAALERTLNATHGSDTDTRYRHLMRRVVDSDALHVRQRVAELPGAWRVPGGGKRIVLIDERETSHVDSSTSATNRRGHFAAMTDTARLTHADADLWILRSADAGAGDWLSNKTQLPGHARVLDVAHSLRDILRQADAVYVVGASEGMAALLAGVPVHVFGTPYYAGWGLTQDRAAMPERRARPCVSALFDAAFLQLAHYLDPIHGTQGTLENALDCIELQHAVADRYSDLGRVAGIGFQWWKRPYATPYLSAGGGTLRWIADPRDMHTDEHAAIWGGRSAEGLPDGAARVRIEDGFIHSTGLGSDMSPPCSQVIDRRGLYFDASRPSDLTVILNQATFDEPELQRAAALRQRLVQLGLTKYNLGRQAPTWHVPNDRCIVLVAGQVADDASIRLGTGTIATSEALLQEVRARRPDAFIIYKPHPDVLSGNRAGLVDAEHLADVVDTHADLVSLIDVADELHTLSSLAGFDALLRGKEVHTYGLPFYAGWGLTHDALEQPWRERRLSLDMLTAGVLLRYAIYWDWQLSLFTTPEAIARQLAPNATRPLDKIRGNRARPLVKAIRWTRNAIGYAGWQGRQYFHDPTTR